MSNPAQRELIEFNLKLALTTKRLYNAEETANMSFGYHTNRGIAPEDVDASLTILEIIESELGKVESGLRQCRMLIKQICRALGYDDSLYPILRPLDEEDER